MFDKFFRNRAVSAFLKSGKNCVLPDISKCSTMALLINYAQFARLDELEKKLNELFAPDKCIFFVISDGMNYNILVDDKVNFVTKTNFNFFGKLKNEVRSSFSSETYDLVVNLSDSNTGLITEEYVMTFLKTSFRISFGESYESLYDLVLDSKDDDLIAKIETLHKYLLMLSGK